MNVIEFAGYVAAALVFASFWMKTMILLRALAICSNLAFIIYGFFGDLYPVLILHLLLLPLNIHRLQQMRELIKAVKHADPDSFSMDWALPHATPIRLGIGDTLFRKGDAAEAMYYLINGQARVEEFGADIGNGEMIGEIGLFSSTGKRTATVVCATDCELLMLSFDTVHQLCIQNPHFGLYLMNVIVRRLVANLERMESERPDAIRPELVAHN